MNRKKFPVQAILKRIAARAPDADTRALALSLAIRLRLPMSRVLEAVEGDSISDKARRIGVTRQTYYAWLNGEYRPLLPQARKLAELTPYTEYDIAGVPEL